MSGPNKALRAFLSRVRPASEDIHEVMGATSPYIRYVGNRSVPTDLLGGGIGGASDDARRVQDLIGQMESPDGYIRRLIADDAGDVVEGQHRLEALRGLEVPKTPIHLIEDMSRGYDLPRMQDAVSGLHPDQQTQMIRHALDGLRQYGSRAADELEMPSGYFSKYFQDAIRAAGEPPANMPDIAPLRRFYAEGGFVEPARDDVTSDEMALYGSQYYAGGGAVDEPQEYSWGGEVRRWLKTLADTRKQPLGVALDEGTIPKVVEDGRFKSLFETGTSNGSISTNLRSRTEQDLFGLERYAPDNQRPIYGHIFNPNIPASMIDNYGDWIAALDPRVRQRATITYGDSLGANLEEGIGPYRYTDDLRSLLGTLKESPAIQGRMDSIAKDEAALTSLSSFARFRKPRPPGSFAEYARSRYYPEYMEAQIHGGLPWSDVTGLVSVPPRNPLEMPRLADKAGRPVYGRDTHDEAPWFRATPGSYGVEEIGPQFPLSEIGYAGGGAVRKWLRGFKDIFDKPVSVNFDTGNLDDILRDGRFKSLHETGTSGGLDDPAFRLESEAIFDPFRSAHGIDPNIPPIYGHLQDRNLFSDVGNYGDLTAILDRSVNKRSTFTLADSLGHEGPVYSLAERPRDQFRQLNDEIAARRAFRADVLRDPMLDPNEGTIAGIADSIREPYIEAQVHGGLPWSDVRAVLNQIRLRPGDSTIDLAPFADKTGLPWFRAIDGADSLHYPGPVQPRTWWRTDPGNPITREIDPADLAEFGYAEGGEVVEPEGYQTGGKAIRSWMRTLVDTLRQPIGITTPETALPKIIEDGRFKNLFETGEGMGSNDQNLRRKVEQRVFGIDPDVPPTDRPIYGHLYSPEMQAKLHSIYGDWTAVLDPSVRNRATATLGDSFGIHPFEGQGPFHLGGEPRDYFGAVGFDPLAESLIKPSMFHTSAPRSFNEFSEHARYPGYIEAQISGGVPWSDVTGATYTRPKDPRYIDSLQEMADLIGVNTYSRVKKYDAESPWWKAVPGDEAGPQDYGLTLPVSEFGYAEGGSVEMQTGGNALRRWLQKVSDPIKAWHGTPHTIDKFDSSKIGTGEGAQVYGHGLYFAENPEVAKWYRETLSGANPDWFDKITGKPVDSFAAHNFIQKDLGGINADNLTAFGTLWDHLRMPAFSDNPQGVVDWMKTTKGMDPKLVDDVYNKLTSLYEVRQPGNLYEVGIHEDPNKFLSLDLPWAAQGKTGATGLDVLEQSLLRRGEDTASRMPSKFWTPGQHRDVVLPEFARDAADAGMPGIRYLDGMSRNRGSGTHNYVVFPGADDIIDITGRYAEGGRVASPDEMALYGSQYYQVGGPVRKTANALIDYLSGVTGGQRKAADFHEWHGKPTKDIQHDVANYTLTGMAPEFYDSLPPVGAMPFDRAVRDAAESYTGASYRNFNEALRNRAPGDSYDDIIKDADEHYWSFAGLDDRRDLAALGRFLESRPAESLPADIFRGSHLVADGLPDYGPRLLRGDGFGSFSYDPRKARGFINPLETSDFSQLLDSSSGKLPFVARLPKGSEVRGLDLRAINKYEHEHLLAPQQGFKATDVYVPLGGDHVLMDIEPHSTYDMFAPAIYAEGGEVEDHGPPRGYFGGY